MGISGPVPGCRGTAVGSISARKPGRLGLGLGRALVRREDGGRGGGWGGHGGDLADLRGGDGARPPRGAFAAQLFAGLGGAEVSGCGGPLAWRAPADHPDTTGHGSGAAGDLRGGGVQAGRCLRGHEDPPEQQFQLQARGGCARHGAQRLIREIGGA